MIWYLFYDLGVTNIGGSVIITLVSMNNLLLRFCHPLDTKFIIKFANVYSWLHAPVDRSLAGREGY